MGDREYSSTDGDHPRGNPGGGGWFSGGGGGGGSPYGGGYRGGGGERRAGIGFLNLILLLYEGKDGCYRGAYTYLLGVPEKKSMSIIYRKLAKKIAHLIRFFVTFPALNLAIMYRSL